jgi:hypothetical protein
MGQHILAQFITQAKILLSTLFWDVMLYSLVDVHHSACHLLGLLFNLGDGGSKFLRNISKLLPDYIGFEILTGVVMKSSITGI